MLFMTSQKDQLVKIITLSITLDSEKVPPLGKFLFLLPLVH